MTRTTLTFREENEIGLMIAGELIELVFNEQLNSSEIKSTLREVVNEIGIGHTDEHLKSVTIQRILHNLGGRI